MPLLDRRRQGFINSKHEGQPGEDRCSAIYLRAHRPGLQARDLHKAQTSKVAGGLGRYSRPLALPTAFCSVKTTPAEATAPLTGIDGEMRCLIPPQGEPALAGSMDRTGRRQLQIAIFEQELHLATLKHVLKRLLNRALHSPAPGVQGAAEIDLSGVFKGWS